MKIFICCSKHFYSRVAPIKRELEESGHIVTLPNSYDEPLKEEKMKLKGSKEHIRWKSEMLKLQVQKVQRNDAILVINFEKNEQQNYIGGSTFLEIYKAFELGKKIFLINQIPEGIFKDELEAMNPIILKGDLSKIK